MRATILKLLLASMVFVSVEGVAESIDDLSFHQSHHAHAEDSANQWFPDADDDDHLLDNCEHFCHGHSVGLISQLVVPTLPNHGVYAQMPQVVAKSQHQTPPTPPPNILS